MMKNYRYATRVEMPNRRDRQIWSRDKRRSSWLNNCRYLSWRQPANTATIVLKQTRIKMTTEADEGDYFWRQNFSVQVNTPMTLRKINAYGPHNTVYGLDSGKCSNWKLGVQRHGKMHVSDNTETARNTWIKQHTQVKDAIHCLAK